MAVTSRRGFDVTDYPRIYRAEKSFVVITDGNRHEYGLTKQIVFAECAPGTEVLAEPHFVKVASDVLTRD